MTTITLDFEQDVYLQLEAEANRIRKAPADLVKEWVADRLSPKPVSKRDQARAVLHKAGLLTSPTPHMQNLASQTTATLDEIKKALDKTGGKPLSEIILEQRGPKE